MATSTSLLRRAVCAAVRDAWAAHSSLERLQSKQFNNNNNNNECDAHACHPTHLSVKFILIANQRYKTMHPALDACCELTCANTKRLVQLHACTAYCPLHDATSDTSSSSWPECLVRAHRVPALTSVGELLADALALNRNNNDPIELTIMVNSLRQRSFAMGPTMMHMLHTTLPPSGGRALVLKLDQMAKNGLYLCAEHAKVHSCDSECVEATFNNDTRMAHAKCPLSGALVVVATTAASALSTIITPLVSASTNRQDLIRSFVTQQASSSSSQSVSSSTPTTTTGKGMRRKKPRLASPLLAEAAKSATEHLEKQFETRNAAELVVTKTDRAKLRKAVNSVKPTATPASKTSSIVLLYNGERRDDAQDESGVLVHAPLYRDSPFRFIGTHDATLLSLFGGGGGDESFAQLFMHARRVVRLLLTSSARGALEANKVARVIQAARAKMTSYLTTPSTQPHVRFMCTCSSIFRRETRAVQSLPPTLVFSMMPPPRICRNVECYYALVTLAFRRRLLALPATTPEMIEIRNALRINFTIDDYVPGVLDFIKRGGLADEDGGYGTPLLPRDNNFIRLMLPLSNELATLGVPEHRCTAFRNCVKLYIRFARQVGAPLHTLRIKAMPSFAHDVLSLDTNEQSLVEKFIMNQSL